MFILHLHTYIKTRILYLGLDAGAPSYPVEAAEHHRERCILEV